MALLYIHLVLTLPANKKLNCISTSPQVLFGEWSPQEKINIFQTLNKCFKNRGNKQLNAPNIFGITSTEDVFPTRVVAKHGPHN